MSKFEDIIGKRYNNLVVEAITGKDKHGNNLYLCRCDCGNTIITTAHSLNTGDRKSCGCGRRKDITGQQFWGWTVISYAKNGKWNCRCKCGTTREVLGADLRYGKSKSCGCRHSTNLVGEVFGRLKVIKDMGTRTQGEKTEKIYLCKCECGKEIEVPRCRLVTGNTRSCGCLHKELLSEMSTTHGFRKNKNVPKLYKAWRNIKNRCENKNSKDYKSYGQRGIKICDEWRNDFQAFYDWAMANGYKEEVLSNGYNKWTIDRINANGNYEPSNCRWITIQAQQLNKRTTVYLTYKNETLPLMEMANKYNIPYQRLYQRIRAGWDIDRAMTATCEE